MNVPEQMIVIHMADSYYAMHKRIYWWLTSKRKNVILCWRDKETRMALYLDAMTYPMSIIFIHLSMITCMLQL